MRRINNEFDLRTFTINHRSIYSSFSFVNCRTTTTITNIDFLLRSISHRSTSTFSDYFTSMIDIFKSSMIIFSCLEIELFNSFSLYTCSIIRSASNLSSNSISIVRTTSIHCWTSSTRCRTNSYLVFQSSFTKTFFFIFSIKSSTQFEWNYQFKTIIQSIKSRFQLNLFCFFSLFNKNVFIQTNFRLDKVRSFEREWKNNIGRSSIDIEVFWLNYIFIQRISFRLKDA